MNRKLQTLFGLKWNPFLPGVPTEALFESTQLRSFRERVEILAKDGGFAMLTGESGLGKSAALRLLQHSLESVPDVTAGVLTRPQSSVYDFYREIGQVFGVELSPCNRWGGTMTLRAEWLEYIERTGTRPVLIVDEAQEMRTDVLSEIRLLSSYMLDSQLLLVVVLAGDNRLLERLRTPDLMPLATRVRVRLSLEPLPPEVMREVLEHAVAEAGAPHLMTAGLAEALSTHAAGNLRIMMNTAAELLDAALAREQSRLDEQLFFEVYGDLHSTSSTRRRSRTR